MRLRTIIVEDSKELAETVSHLLEHSSADIDLLGIADNLKAAGELIRNEEIDLALLDIQLKEDNVFKLLEELKAEDRINFDIVFITAHSSFENAVRAIQYACIDFISKPVSQEVLDTCLAKVTERAENRQPKDQRVDVLLEMLSSNFSKPESISVALPRGVIEVVAMEDIAYLQADANTCVFHLNNDNHLHSTRSLGSYARLLESHPDFMQISRELIVNLLQIKRYDHRNKSLSLKNGVTLSASHRYSKYLKQKLNDLNLPGSGKGLFGFMK